MAIKEIAIVVASQKTQILAFLGLGGGQTQFAGDLAHLGFAVVSQWKKSVL